MIDEKSNNRVDFNHHQLGIIDFFDKHANHWENYTSTDIISRAEKLLDLVTINTGDTVLDVGCGIGVLIPYLTKRIGEKGVLIEVDISSKMLQVGMKKTHRENIYWLTADGHFLPLKTESTNVVICYAVFPHFTNKDIAIKEISRVLKPGGILGICHSHSSIEINKIHKNIGGIVENHCIPEISKIKNWCENSGMEISHYQDGENGYLLIAVKKHPLEFLEPNTES
ncbi:MAG: class I SAM-dependent methyltransferase [Candidatus Hydrogenedentes bacterium]|nr:class I SAM-dependent methyltransferase [Candidatus Hydrogenedentota bacterium]